MNPTSLSIVTLLCTKATKCIFYVIFKVDVILKLHKIALAVNIRTIGFSGFVSFISLLVVMRTLNLKNLYLLYILMEGKSEDFCILWVYTQYKSTKIVSIRQMLQ
jgi:hypothetical protein